MSETASAFPAFPMARTDPLHPPPQYADLRAESPVTRVRLPTGIAAWVVAGYEQVRELLVDPRLSIRRDNPGFPMFAPVPDVVADLSPSLIGLDAPEHTHLRRRVISEFTVKRIRQMQPRIQRLVDAHVDAMLSGERPVDLVQGLALPVPSLVICELLGVPYDDHDFFQEKSSAFLTVDDASPQDKWAAVLDLAAYMDRLVERAAADPGDDMLGRFIARCREEDDFDPRVAADLGRLLLIAGHETTANMISLGVVALLENPDQLDALRADASLWPQAVEELLRYFTIADYIVSRTALADVEIGGQTIRKGEGVMLLTAAANRDPSAFEGPDALDVRRRARNHVAFGYGIHQCLGQNLARLELEIVYDTLFTRIPGLRLAEPSQSLPYKHQSLVYGLHRLPVTW
ncbi:MAG: cytochrome P450 [Stackebrandtia sp.]